MLSLCMIVKNEEKWLDKCLNSVISIIDDIVIIDTGSVDKTENIARKYKARLFKYKTPNNFSIVRNISLRKAVGDWILVLDADEQIDKSDINKIREIVSYPNNHAYHLNRYNYTQNGGWSRQKMLRLFKNNKKIRYCYNIFEILYPSIENLGYSIHNCEVKIHHFGLLNNNEIYKVQKYQKMIKRGLKINEPRRKTNLLRKLAYCYYCMNLFDEAINACNHAIATKINDPFSSMLNYITRGKIFLSLNLYNYAESDFKKSMEFGYRTRLSATPNNLLGVLYYMRVDYKKAKQKFIQGIQLDPNCPELYVNLGLLHENTNKQSEALKYYMKAIKINPYLLQLEVKRNSNINERINFDFNSDVSTDFKGLRYHINNCSEHA